MLNPNIKALRCLLEVARNGSFTKAAQKLNLTQPSLSTQISQMEKNFGIQFFARSTRHVELTDEGASLLEYAERVVEAVDRLDNAARRILGDHTNRIRLGAALYTFAIRERQELIEEFTATYPDVDFKINAHTQLEILNDLAADKLDLAILLGIPIDDDEMEKGGRAELTYPESLVRYVLRRESVDLLIPKESPLAHLDEIPDILMNGVKVVMPSDEHGDQLIKPIRSFLRKCGAVEVPAPEGTASATERYGAKMRLPTITFGWFDVPENWSCCRKKLAGLSMSTQLSIVARAENEIGAVNKFISFAKREFCFNED